MNLKISPENIIKAHFSRLIDFVFFAFFKEKFELHQMNLHITIDCEVI